MSPLGLTLAAAGLVLVAACGAGDEGDHRPAGQADSGPIATSSNAPPGTPASRRTVTIRDDGTIIVLETGESAELLIRDPLAPDPVVEGSAVRLIEVTNVTGSKVREWEVQAVEPGAARLHGQERGTPFDVTVRVR